MMYICKGCADACSGCAKGCNQCCSEVCTPCNKVLERPLGGYVLSTFFVCIPAVVLALAGMASDARKCNNVSLLCIVDIGFSVAHLVFAVYVQWRLVKGLEGDQNASTAKDLLKNANTIILWDIGFLLYLVVFFGSFFFNLLGMTWLGDCPLNTNWVFLAALILVLFGLFGIGFACLWYCALSCDACSGGGLIGAPERRSGKDNRGMISKFIFGSMLKPPQQQQQPVAAAQYGQPTPVNVATGQPSYTGGTPQVPSQPPPQQKQSQSSQKADLSSAAGAAAGAAAGVAGAGLEAAGKWIGKKAGKK